MAFKIIILERADFELEEAYLYYENIQSKLGDKFILEYESYLNTLKNIPFFEQRYQSVRILPLKKFPYSIHFTLDELQKIVTIHAVICDYQNPKKTRIKF